MANKPRLRATRETLPDGVDGFMGNPGPYYGLSEAVDVGTAQPEEDNGTVAPVVAAPVAVDLVKAKRRRKDRPVE